jgi:integrase
MALALARRIEDDIVLGRFTGDTSIYKPPKVTKKKKVEKYFLADKFEDFLLFKKSSVRTSTYKSKYEDYRDRVVQILGKSKNIEDFPLSKCRNLVQNWSKNCAYSTLQIKVGVFILFWDWLQQDEAISINPWKKALAGIAKDEIKKPKPFSKDERERILKTMENNSELKPWKPVVHFLMLTGCRPSEAFALTFADVDQEASLISICKGAVKGIIDKTKTGKSRTIPLTNAIMECLESAAIDRDMQSGDLVFPNPEDGKIIQDYNIRNRWKKICKLADVPYRKLYSNRHTFISEALTQGGNPLEVAAIAGNSPNVIYKHYASIMADASRSMPDI